MSLLHPTLLILAKPLPEAQKDKKREVDMMAVLVDGRGGAMQWEAPVPLPSPFFVLQYATVVSGNLE